MSHLFLNQYLFEALEFVQNDNDTGWRRKNESLTVLVSRTSSSRKNLSVISSWSEINVEMKCSLSVLLLSKMIYGYKLVWLLRKTICLEYPKHQKTCRSPQNELIQIDACKPCLAGDDSCKKKEFFVIFGKFIADKGNSSHRQLLVIGKFVEFDCLLKVWNP